MKFFNTMGRELQEFTPINPPKVTFYHCGPTVYWVQHLGNMRAMVMADLVRRALLYEGYEVEFVRNYTDVGHLTEEDIESGEDRMAVASKREGISPEAIADKYIKIFERDIAELNVLPADHKPRATKYIEEMQAMVQTLLDKGYAYITEQAVYFDISKKDDYTKLSGQILEANRTGAGSGTVQDTQKRNPQDFALWFFKTGEHKTALQTWKSPFESPAPDVKDGEGFPGWHIECSTMSTALLGPTIDIHMGGVEHIPVHHTNEIAQSECATGQVFANYWLHNEWLVGKGRKISKSQGDQQSVEEAKQRGFDPMDIRYLFLQSHYRSKQVFDWDILATARKGRLNLLKKLEAVARKMPEDEELHGDLLELWDQKFREAIGDDVNVPKGLAILWDMLKSDEKPEDILTTVFEFDRVLGLRLEEYLMNADLGDIGDDDVPEEILTMLEQREQARKDKDFALADSLREQIKDRGYEIIDTGEGSKLRKLDA